MNHSTTVSAVNFPFQNQYHSLHPPLTSAEYHAYAHATPRFSFGKLGSLFTALQPVHTFVLSLSKVVDYRPYRLENMSACVFGSQGTRINKQPKRSRAVAADFLMLDGSRPIALFKFFKVVRVDSNEVYVMEGMALVLFEHLLSKEDDSL